MDMLGRLKKVIAQLNKTIEDIELVPEKKVGKCIEHFSNNMELMSEINSINASGDKISKSLVLTSMKANSPKIKDLEEFIVIARRNLLNVAEINAHLTELEDDSASLLRKTNMESEDLESEVLALIPLIKNKSDSELASYIRTALDRVTELTKAHQL